jgi:hypothetical protein
MSENNPTPEEIAAKLKLGITIPCAIILPSLYGIEAVAAVELGKSKGLIRDLNHCKELAGDAGKLGEILGNKLAGIIAGRYAECACEHVFSDKPAPRDPTPPPTPQDPHPTHVRTDGCKKV